MATQTLEGDLAIAERTLEAVSKFSAKPEPAPSAFAPYEKRYRTLTEGMRVALARQQLIPRFIQTPARGQIGVSINQAAVETAQIHTEIKTKQAEFQAKVNALSEKVAPIARRCGDPSTQINIAPQTAEKLKLQCARILPIAKQFTIDIQQINNSFEKLEVVWREEQEKQQAIVRSADIAAR